MMDEKKDRKKSAGFGKTRTVFQMEATECGAAALTMILAYYGKHISLEEVRTEVGVSRDGSRAGNIMRAGQRYGMEVHGYRKEIEGLLELRPPCIIHWNFNHFVVYEGVKRGQIHINDPGVGHRRLTMQEFDEGYTGIVITFTPTSEFTKQKRTHSFWKLGIERLNGQYKGIFALVLVGFILVFPSFLMAAFSQVFLDRIFIEKNDRWLAIFLAVMLLNVVFQTLFMKMQYELLLKQQNKMSLVSAQKFLTHLFRLPMSFFEQRYAGDLSSRIQNNDNVSLFLGGELANTLISLFESFFYLLILFFYSPVLVLIALLGLTIDLALIIFASEKLKEISMKMNQDSGKMVGTLYAGLTIRDSIKAAGAENDFVGRLLGYYAKLCNSEQKMKKTQQILNAFPQAIMAVLNVLILMIGSIQVIHSNMTIGMLVAFTSLFTAFLTPVNKLTSFVYQIQMTKTDMNRVKDIMGYEEEEKYQKKQVEFTGRLQGEVCLKDVTFGYSKVNNPVIQNVNLKVQRGQSIAIVGASGSGKSTVAKLICGLYEPWSGQVEIDGKGLEEISNDTMRMSVADVSQSITIFGGTIRDNITLWNKKIGDEDIIRAAQDACIHDVITAKPNAYEFMMDEGGHSLSGGQRQRLEIARALVLNPSVIIMDEATSALDSLLEKQVIGHIKNRGCTCIIVAHRLSAIRDCEEILVMDRGQIVERGTHESLMEHGNVYQKLIQLN